MDLAIPHEPHKITGFNSSVRSSAHAKEPSQPAASPPTKRTYMYSASLSPFTDTHRQKQCATNTLHKKRSSPCAITDWTDAHTQTQTPPRLSLL